MISTDKYRDSDFNMEPSTSLVQGLENQLREAEEIIKLRDRAKRLVNNRDFKEIIENQFCLIECARLAQASADPNLSTQDRELSLSMAQAAGHLRRFLQAIFRKADQAEKDLEELRANIEAARHEEEMGEAYESEAY